MLLLTMLLTFGGTAPATPLPWFIPAALSVYTEGRWVTLWSSDVPPERWRAPHPSVARAVQWEPVQPGVEYGELRVAGAGAWRLRVQLVRLDPRLLRFELMHEVEDGAKAKWEIGRAPPEASVAANAGHFSERGPWGWVVVAGQERSTPGTGSLAVALVLDREGHFHWVRGDSLPAVRAAGSAVHAFQSFPVLLDHDGEVPLPLRTAGLGVNISHRDIRLALGEIRDGHLLLALTRIDSPLDVLSGAPWGPTIPEMAALMGAVGCHRAVMLDGGISGQLLIRDGSGESRSWPGFRKVPLGLVAFPRGERPATR